MVVGFFSSWIFAMSAVFGHSIPHSSLSFFDCASPADISSGGFSSNPCMRSAHCKPTTAPFTGCSNASDATNVNGR